MERTKRRALKERESETERWGGRERMVRAGNAHEQSREWQNVNNTAQCTHDALSTPLNPVIVVIVNTSVH